MGLGRFRFVNAIALTTCALLLSVSAAIGTDANDGDRIDDAVEFRRTFGFAHTRDFVERTFQETDTYDDARYGVPLSAEETDEMVRRARNRTQQRDAVDYATAQPEFGGLWFDQKDGGTAHYSFTSDVAKHRNAILGMAPDSAEVHVTRVDYRMSELEAVKDEITRDMLKLINDGLPIAMVDANAEANRVIVYLTEPQEEAMTDLRARYGPTVITGRGAAGYPDCANRGDCRDPLRGGIRIFAADGGRCTAAFQAKKANGDRVMITAGHCLNEHGGSGVSWTHSNNQFGVSQGNSLSGSSVVADIGWIKIDGNEDTDPADRFFRDSDHKNVAFGGLQPNSQQVEGDPVCRSGENSGWDCGVIKNTGVSKPNGEGQTITKVWTWSRDSKEGDSGGTMVTEVVFPGQDYWFVAGLHVHSTPDDCPEEEGTPNTCRSWYSTAQQVENEVITDPADLTICLDSDC